MTERKELAGRLRERLGGVTVQETMHGDNLAILLASYFEDWADEDEETDESGTWKKSAIDASNKVLDAIHAHYAAALDSLSPPEGVGLVRYNVDPVMFNGSPAYRMNPDPGGKWVRYEDAAAALATIPAKPDTETT